jgi:hypothetical protein
MKKRKDKYEDLLQRYANSRLHDFKKRRNADGKIYCYSIIDPQLIRVDIWPDRKYKIVYAKYWLITKESYVKTKQKANNPGYRKDERGTLPSGTLEMARFLDHIFFDADVLEERRLAKHDKSTIGSPER